MKYLKDRAIILSTRDYGEADRLVAFLTRQHGKLIGVAKHARKSKKRFVNSLDNFNLIEVEFGEKSSPGLVFIRRASLDESFTRLRDDLLKLTCAGLVSEVIKEMVPEGVGQPEVFDLFLATLYKLESTRQPVNVSCLSLWRFLVMQGLAPRLDLCLVCKKKTTRSGTWNFDPSVGGIVCVDHCKRNRKIGPVTRGIVSLLEKARNVEIEKLWRFKLSPKDGDLVLQIVVEYIQYYIGKPLKSTNVLSQLGYAALKSDGFCKSLNSRNTALVY